jgi:hypothetical protein
MVLFLTICMVVLVGWLLSRPEPEAGFWMRWEPGRGWSWQV